MCLYVIIIAAILVLYYLAWFVTWVSHNKFELPSIHLFSFTAIDIESGFTSLFNQNSLNTFDIHTSGGEAVFISEELLYSPQFVFETEQLQASKQRYVCVCVCVFSYVYFSNTLFFFVIFFWNGSVFMFFF